MNESQPKPRYRLRRFFRFSLRTFLILVALIGVGLGVHLHRAKTQQAAVEAIRDYGGWVRYDYQFPTAEFDHTDFDPEATSPVPRWLLDAVGIDFFHSVVQVNLNYTTDGGMRMENHNPSDEALQHVGKLPEVRVLLLSETQATDESLRHIGRLRKLEMLYMWDAVKVSDDELAMELVGGGVKLGTIE